MDMIEKASWEDFRQSGLLWFVNRTLHLFGWALTCLIDEDGKIVEVYPARCRFRGFDSKTETEGFANLTTHIEQRIPEMKKDIELP